jgi:hypothetical protein
MLAVTARSLNANVNREFRAIGVFTDIKNITESRLVDMVADSLPDSFGIYQYSGIKIEMHRLSGTQWLSVCHDEAGACKHVSYIEIASVMHF